MSKMTAKKIIIGVTASVAIYRTLDLIRDLQSKEVELEMVMTPDATKFIQPLQFSALLGKEVWVDPFSEKMPHIHLSRMHDLLLIAPCTMDFINKLACGICDNLLLSLCLATKDTPIALAPAMNPEMWQHPTTQESIQKLKTRGVKIITPETGKTLCGEVGPGRLAPRENILSEVLNILGHDKKEKSVWQGKSVLITAGPTRNAIDPVRYITNASSGAMGIAIANTLVDRGATVTLALSKFASASTLDYKGKLVHFDSHDSLGDQYHAFLKENPTGTIFAAAAPSDMEVVNGSSEKRPKSELQSLQLKPLPDLLAQIGQDRHPRSTLIGFCVETHDLLTKARAKMKHKNCDFMIANEHAVLGSDHSQCHMLRSGVEEVLTFSLKNKSEIAQQVCDSIAKLKNQKLT
jgi:phosphopantothenoylcysteine decarboxylase / phosphopantothenate---cysteine ligase